MVWNQLSEELKHFNPVTVIKQIITYLTVWSEDDSKLARREQDMWQPAVICAEYIQGSLFTK